jgi:hypothetical protein
LLRRSRILFSQMKLEHLRGEIALVGGLKQTGPTKPILDMLEESKLIQINDDIVKMAGAGPLNAFLSGGIPPFGENIEQTARTDAGENHQVGRESVTQSLPKIPLPLGPTRLAYIQLPADWEPKELKKLIKILQIALGDDSENV